MLATMLGLPADEATAYRELLSLPSATPTELAARVGVEATESRRLLDALEQQGLVARSIEDVARFVAAPPSVAIGALLVRRQHEIRLAEAEMGSLDELYRSAASQRGAVEVVEVIRGPDAIRRHLEQLQLGAREEMAAFVKAPATVLSTEDNSAEEHALDRGVRVRVLLERSMLDAEPGLMAEIERVVAKGEEVRLAASLPMKLLVVDRVLAILPVLGSADIGTAGALLVHRSGLLDALIALFEATWESSQRVMTTAAAMAGNGAGGLDDLDAKILSLLLAGLNDGALANQLGLSLRTVQRRVRGLMQRAGVDTRIQLGWRAVHLGWTDRVAAPGPLADFPSVRT